MKIIGLFFLLIVYGEALHGQRQRPKMTHDQIIKELQIESDRQNVYWYVWCTAYYEGDPEKYQAVATKGGVLKIYVEEGASPYWQVSGGFKTADAAAYALLQALKHPPNTYPQHREKKREDCPQPLKGSPRMSPMGDNP